MDETLLSPNVGRRQYLVTYAQADMSKFPTRGEFGKQLLRLSMKGPLQSKQTIGLVVEKPQKWRTPLSLFHQAKWL